MRPFLFVGCGGSGGVTLQFLLDQLTADLSLRGVGKVPDAWQFLHVDVPVSPDGVGAGMPPVVTDYGNASYVGLAPAAGAYPAVANALAQQLIAAGRYDQLATWYANPNKVAVPIALGAGQKRAVGRVVTLARLKQVREGLTEAFRRLNAPGVREELRAVTSRVSRGTESLVDTPPVIVVVSSMAGGAGASMVLDVCRVLSQQEGVDPAATALFLYTPEVFDSLAPEDRSGIPGNALAMAGELMATQLGAAAADDLAIFSSVGLGQGRPGRSVPFGRVFPVGAKIGNTGTAFGDGELSQIYRGVGRGLAALVLSGEATKRWTSFDLTNDGSVNVDSTHFGWSADKKDLQWGSFGFAQLNMGRDRYAEYAAQRLARAAVLRLVAGHRQPGDQGTDQEQRDRLANERFPHFAAELGLPAADQDLEQWFTALFQSPALGSAQVLVERHVDWHLSGGAGAHAEQWLLAVQHAMAQTSATLNGDAEAEGYRHVYAWYERTLPTVERAVEVAVSTYGIPVTVELLRRVDAMLTSVVAGMAQGADSARHDATAVAPDTLARAAAVKGAINPRSGPIQLMREGYTDSCYRAVFAAAAAKLTDVLSAMRTDLLGPLRDACSDTNRTLEAAVSSDRRSGTLVQLRTDVFAEWPVAGQQVPARFTHAQNEVLLIDASLFAEQLDHHVQRTMDLPARPVHSPSDAIELASREIALYDWPTSGTALTGRLLEQRARWRPAALSTDPGTREPVASRRAQYRLAANPAELLERAREWVRRPRQPLDEFVSTSLRDYVGSADLSEALRAERLEDMARKFRETLQLAQPLVAVDADLVAKLHDGYRARVAYKFSEVPFDGLTVAQDVSRHLEQSGAHQTSVDNFSRALRATSSATRVDVFGSYPPLAPLVFTSLFRPLATAWDEAVMPGARMSFWAGRRARRLVGAVAMNERQRRAIVAGWYVARYTGRLRLPGEVPGVQAVQVWDPEGEHWVSFPSPLAVPELELERTANNYLPAVLLSYGLAAAQSTATAGLTPLLPYTVLRQYWDSSVEGVDPSIDDDPALLSATQHFRRYFTDPAFPTGAPPRFSQPLTGVFDVDVKAVVERLLKVHATVGRDYLQPSENGATGGGKHSVIRRPDDLWGVPLFHEIAGDVHWATERLLDVLVRGLAPEDDDEELT